MKAPARVLVLVSAMLAAISIPACLHYTTDLSIARQRIGSGSTLLDTSCGAIEYAAAGAGTPLLLIHGAGGGFDQGLAFGQPLTDHGVRVIAPSRFGYLRSPVPADVSVEAQADAYVCLLDHLKIDRAVVLGASAGAPSAMQFCIRHANRCSALVLVVPAAYSPVNAKQTMRIPPSLDFVVDHVLSSNEVLWLMARLNPALLVRTMLGTPREDFDSASPAERKRAIDMLDEVQPVRARVQGLQIDARITSTLPRYELERIEAPALLISVKDDLYGTWGNASYTASQIPGSKFISYPSGGHIWLGHGDEVHREIADFIAALAPGASAP